jgi:hypothetical protein
MLKFYRSGILASSAFALVWLASSAPGVHAEETQVTMGRVLFCDTAAQIEAVLSSDGSDISARLMTVNDRYGKESCNVVTAMFYLGDEAKTVLVPDGIVRITKVNMVGYRAGDAWMRMTKPVEQYIGVLEKATSV